ncbi:TraR/DksA C4-type zinc finger protein [bacterium]|nr:TraR/DksA C4-type zinc finger protein [bacterium]
MDKELLKKLEEKLEREKERITKELEEFAKEDKKPKGDWDTIHPQMGRKLEEKADEVEEYESLLPVEYALEKRLKDINDALEKIRNGKDYGICEKCHKEIEVDRLLVCPEARYCLKCAK